MGTELVGTLTHADASHRGNAQDSAPHAFITLCNKYTYEIMLCGCYAYGPNPRDQNRMLLKRLKELVRKENPPGIKHRDFSIIRENLLYSDIDTD
jgi:hypothetical protein